MMTFMEEEMTLDQLLTHSEIIEPYKRYVKSNSVDEICVWKSIAPMCIYIKTKRKKDSKSKQKIQYWKAQHLDNNVPLKNSNCQYRNHVRNLAYYSTNVLSYDSPSSRNIVDLKTYKYIERDNSITMPNYLVTKKSYDKIGDENNNQLFQDYFYPPDISAKKEVYMSDCNHERYNELMIKYGNDIPRPMKQPSLFQLQLNSGSAALPFNEQLKLITQKLTLSDNKDEPKEEVANKKTDNYFDKQNYTKINTKFKKKRRYDNELVKIRTCLPPVIQSLGTVNTTKNYGVNIDDSEEECDFPFKVSGVRDGTNKMITQDISINRYSNLVIHSRDLDCCSRGKYEKLKEKIELPPIAGLHIS